MNGLKYKMSKKFALMAGVSIVLTACADGPGMDLTQMIRVAQTGAINTISSSSNEEYCKLLQEQSAHKGHTLEASRRGIRCEDGKVVSVKAAAASSEANQEASSETVQRASSYKAPVGLVSMPPNVFKHKTYNYQNSTNFDNFLHHFRPTEVWASGSKSVGCYPGKTELRWNNAVLKATAVSNSEAMKVGRTRMVQKGCVFENATLTYTNGDLLKASMLGGYSLTTKRLNGAELTITIGDGGDTITYFRENNGMNYYLMGKDSPKAAGKLGRGIGVMTKSKTVGNLEPIKFLSGKGNIRKKVYFGQIKLKDGTYFVGDFKPVGTPVSEGYCVKNGRRSFCKFDINGKRIKTALYSAKILFPAKVATESLPGGISKSAKTDLLVSRTQDALKQENWTKFLQNKHALESLNFDLGQEIDFFVAKALYNTSNVEQAERALTGYVNTLGNNGNYYTDALELLGSYQKKAKASKELRLSGSSKRKSERRNFCSLSKKLLQSTPCGCQEFDPSIKADDGGQCT